MTLYGLLATRWGRFLVGGPVVFILLSMSIVIGEAGVSRLSTVMLQRQPVTDFFEYESIDYVARENDSLVFASTSSIKESHPMFWNDILRCGPDEDTFRFYSVQNTNSASPRVTTNFRTIEWNYTRPFPVGQVCYLDSTVSMEIRGVVKEQKIKSERFVIE